MIKSQKGITLVALIITIIVMLILAGVSISLVLDEKGVLNRAQSVEPAQVKGALKEAVALASADIMAEYYSDSADYNYGTTDIQTAIQNNYSYQTKYPVTLSGTTLTVANIVDENGDAITVTLKPITQYQGTKYHIVEVAE